MQMTKCKSIFPSLHAHTIMYAIICMHMATSIAKEVASPHKFHDLVTTYMCIYYIYRYS